MLIFVVLSSFIQVLLVDLFVIFGYTSEFGLKVTARTISVLDRIADQFVASPGKDGFVGKSVGGLAASSAMLVIPLILGFTAEKEFSVREETMGDGGAEVVLQDDIISLINRELPEIFLINRELPGIFEKQLPEIGKVTFALQDVSRALERCSDRLSESEIQKARLLGGIDEVSKSCAAALNARAPTIDIRGVERELSMLSKAVDKNSERLSENRRLIDTVDRENDGLIAQVTHLDEDIGTIKERADRASLTHFFLLKKDKRQRISLPASDIEMMVRFCKKSDESSALLAIGERGACERMGFGSVLPTTIPGYVLELLGANKRSAIVGISYRDESPDTSRDVRDDRVARGPS